MKESKKIWEEECKSSWIDPKFVLKFIKNNRIPNIWPYLRCNKCKNIMISSDYYEKLKEELVKNSFEIKNSGICYQCSDDF